MGETALDLCRRAYELYGAGEIPRMLELFDPAVEVYVAPPNFESGTYRGRQEYAALLGLALVDYHGRGQGSAVEIAQPSWELSLWRDERCVRYEVYWDEAEGKRAFAERRG